jgi:hypothetical protein
MRLDLRSDLFPLEFQIKILYALLIDPIPTKYTRVVHPTLIYLIILTILIAEYYEVPHYARVSILMLQYVSVVMCFLSPNTIKFWFYWSI